MEIFLDSISRTREHHIKRVHIEEEEEYKQEDEEEAEELPGKRGRTELLLDLNPAMYEKPRDYLFFDFFSIYAKALVQKRPK